MYPPKADSPVLAMTMGWEYRLVALGLLIALWTILAALPGHIVPYPDDTARKAVHLLATAESWPHLWFTLRRILISFGIILVACTLIGVWTRRRQGAETIATTMSIVALSIPTICFSIVCYL